MEVIFMYNVEKFYGYLTTIGVNCRFQRDPESAYDEVIIVLGKGYKKAIVYSTYQSWILETKANIYIVSNPDEGIANLKEEEII